MVLILVFLIILKNWKSVYEMCFGMFKAFPFTGCCALVHFSSVSLQLNFMISKVFFNLHDSVIMTLRRVLVFLGCDHQKLISI